MTKKKSKPAHERFPAHFYVDLRDEVDDLKGQIERIAAADQRWCEKREQEVFAQGERIEKLESQVKSLFEQILNAAKVAKDALSQVGQWEWQLLRVKEMQEKIRGDFYDLDRLKREVERLCQAHVGCNQKHLDRDEDLREMLNQMRKTIERKFSE